MKRCVYCGKEYSDEVAVCAVDGQPVTKVTPSHDLPDRNQTRPEKQWGRYAAAVLVAFGASVATGLAFASIGVSSRITSDWSSTLSVVFAVCFNLLIGFNGVFFGAACLRRCDRPVGAVVLLALGLGFELLMLGSAHGEFHFPRGAISTGIGGLLAVAVCYSRWSLNKVTSADGGIASQPVPGSAVRRR